MTEIIYGSQSFTGVVNAISASSGQIVRAENFDCTVDQNGSTFFFGFLTKYPRSVKVGDTIGTTNSLGMHLFLPQLFSSDGEYRYLQAFTDGTIRYYDDGTATWISIGTGYATNYHRDWETFATRDVVYMCNGIDDVLKWRTDWTAVHAISDIGGTATTLTGTLSFIDGSAVVSGAGTAFLTEVEIGSYIRKDSTEEYFEVLEVASDTDLTLYTKYVGSTGAGGLNTSEIAPKATVNGRYVKVWKDRLILLGGFASYFLLLETGFHILQETGFKIFS